MMGDLQVSPHAHTMLSVQQLLFFFFTKNSMTPLSYPPYLSALALSNIFFVSLDEKILKGKRFADVGEVKQKMT